jgi:hypothetical protein
MTGKQDALSLSSTEVSSNSKAVRALSCFTAGQIPRNRGLLAFLPTKR